LGVAMPQAMKSAIAAGHNRHDGGEEKPTK